MAKSKEFNPFPYIMGRLFEEQYYEKDGIGYLFESTRKIYSWIAVLYWFKKENYIIEFSIKNVDDDNSVIVYKFNRQKQDSKFEYVIKKAEHKLKRYALSIEPMGDLIEAKAYDEFEAQYKMPVEYIEAADRCLKELNKKLSEELEKASNDGEEKKAA